MKNSRFTSHDGREVELYTWDDVKSPKAVVKIAHGMVEHSARYDDFAKYLNSMGYIVVMNDHRGHGLTAQADSLGYEDGDMWTNNVLDQTAIIDYCREKYNLPVFMMGHSYGSFINQAVMEENPNVAGFILCGSCFMKGLQYPLMKAISSSMCKHKGGRYPATLLANLSFGPYEKKFPGKNAWLNRDQSEVKKYNEDPMCGYVCSANFYRTFGAGLLKLYKKPYYSRIDVDKPVLVIAGSVDPVGGSKGNSKLVKFYKKTVGIKDVESHYYTDARHEILNETCKQEVYKDVSDWIEKVLAR